MLGILPILASLPYKAVAIVSEEKLGFTSSITLGSRVEHRRDSDPMIIKYLHEYDLIDFRIGG